MVNHIALNGKIGTTVTTKPGYVFPGGLTSKVFAATPDNTGYVFYSQIEGHHVNLPDVFDIDTLTSSPGHLLGDQGPADDRQRHRHRPGVPDPVRRVQDGNRVWVQGTRFTDGLPNNVVPANSSRPFEIDVWHDVRLRR